MKCPVDLTTAVAGSRPALEVALGPGPLPFPGRALFPIVSVAAL